MECRCLLMPGRLVMSRGCESLAALTTDLFVELGSVLFCRRHTTGMRNSLCATCPSTISRHAPAEHDSQTDGKFCRDAAKTVVV